MKERWLKRNVTENIEESELSESGNLQSYSKKMKYTRCKKFIKVVAVNLAVLFLLMLVLEGIMRLVGSESICRAERKKASWKRRYKTICEKVGKEEFVIYDSFYTDKEGIFRANPRYDFNSDERYPGRYVINSDGFRGNEFAYVKTSRKKLLLLGDSFLWGASAEPIGKCFADLIETSGYHVYNSGIIGTDPVQYAAIASKYTSLLKPDVVIAFLYMGNDIRREPHPVLPSINLYYDTNFGWLLGYDENGRYFQNGKDVFQYLKKRKCGVGDSLWDVFLYRTVLGKAVYNLLNGKRNSNSNTEKQWVRDSLEQIRQVCKKNGSEFLIFLIPVQKKMETKGNSIKYNERLFKGFRYFYPENLVEEDYCMPPNDHFNNRGHKKFADFVLTVLKDKGFTGSAE